MGTIKYFKTPKKKVVFPVTLSEAVIVGCTTLDRKLAMHDELLSGLRADVDNIVRIPERKIDEIVIRKI